jgi:hypothetical protein
MIANAAGNANDLTYGRMHIQRQRWSLSDSRSMLAMLLNAVKQFTGQFDAFPNKNTHNRLESFLAALADRSVFILG